MASRSSLVVNARVHLTGSRGRSAVITNNIEYVATREGADKSATVDDLRRSELAEKMGLVGYYAERPGSTALFDQNGAVPLRTARRELEKADGAIATVVLSVRRDEACELDLACKEDWQRFCRRNLAPALAEAMGIPESSVRWVAAEHENHPNSKHVHVIAWSSDGSFDSLMARNRLDRARNALTDAALAPAPATSRGRGRSTPSAISPPTRLASLCLRTAESPTRTSAAGTQMSPRLSMSQSRKQGRGILKSKGRAPPTASPWSAAPTSRVLKALRGTAT